MWEWSVLPKYKIQCPRPGQEHGPRDLEESAPPHVGCLLCDICPFIFEKLLIVLVQWFWNTTPALKDPFQSEVESLQAPLKAVGHVFHYRPCETNCTVFNDSYGFLSIYLPAFVSFFFSSSFFSVPHFENQVVRKRYYGSMFASPMSPIYFPLYRREVKGGARAFFSSSDWQSNLTARSLTYHVRYSEGSSKHEQAVEVLDKHQFAIG